MNLINFIKNIYNNKNFNNSFWSSLDVIIYPILYLISTPFFIKHLGTELFGVWLLMITINVSIQVFNFGIGSALIFYTAKYLSSNNTKKLYRIFNTIINFLIIYIPLTIIIGYLFSYILQEKNWFNIAEEYKELAVKSVKIASFIAGTKIIQNIFMSILNGKEIYLPNTLINTFSRIFTLAIAIVLIILDYSIYEILISSLLINIIAIFVLFWQIKIHFNKYSYKLYFGVQEFLEIISYSFWIWLQSIFSTIAFQLDKFFVTAISGPTLLVYYSLSSTIVNQMHTVYGAMSAWLFPRISRLLEQQKDYIKLYLSVRHFVYLFASLSIFILFLISSVLLELWLGTENSKLMKPIFLLFLIYEIFYSHSILPVFLMQGMKKIRWATFYTSTLKISIIIAMIIAFIITKNIESLLNFMIISLLIVLPLLHYFINKKTISQSSIQESILIFIPSILLSIIIFYKDSNFSLYLIIPYLISLYFIYFKKIDFYRFKNS